MDERRANKSVFNVVRTIMRPIDIKATIKKMKTINKEEDRINVIKRPKRSGTPAATIAKPMETNNATRKSK